MVGIVQRSLLLAPWFIRLSTAAPLRCQLRSYHTRIHAYTHTLPAAPRCFDTTRSRARGFGSCKPGGEFQELRPIRITYGTTAVACRSLVSVTDEWLILLCTCTSSTTLGRLLAACRRRYDTVVHTYFEVYICEGVYWAPALEYQNIILYSTNCCRYSNSPAALPGHQDLFVVARFFCPSIVVVIE